MTNLQSLFLYLSTIIFTFVLCIVFTKNSFYRKNKKITLKIGEFSYNYVNKKWWLTVLSFLPMIIIAGTRFDTGADYIQYTWNYSKMMYQSNIFDFIKQSREPLYILSEVFNKLLFGSNVTAWFFLMSLITIVILIVAVYKIDMYVDFSIFSLFFGLYVYLYMFNFVRQFFAMSFVLLALAYGLEGKYMKFCMIVFFATLMHQSSIIFLTLIIFIIKRNIVLNYKYHLIIFISPIFTGVLVFILKKIPFFSVYVTRYLSSDLNIGMGWLVDVIPVMLLYLMNYRSYAKRRYSNVKLLAELSLLIIPVRFLSYYSYAAGRLFIFFSILSVLAFAIQINREKNKVCKILFCTLTLLCYFIFSFYINNNSDVFPYQSVLFEQ